MSATVIHARTVVPVKMRSKLSIAAAHQAGRFDIFVLKQ